MAKTMAGVLRERIIFEKRADLSLNSPPGDGFGNMEGDWEMQFEVAARIMPLKGGEEVMAQRLTGQQPVVVSVRYESRTAAVTPDWRCREKYSGTIYNIRGATNTDEVRGFIDLLCQSGVAT